jgi:hypothetical protein
MISKFAQLEFKYASSEKGKDLYEGILVNYPKRSDVWLMYASMLIKYTLNSQSKQQQQPSSSSSTTASIPAAQSHELDHQFDHEEGEIVQNNSDHDNNSRQISKTSSSSLQGETNEVGSGNNNKVNGDKVTNSDSTDQQPESNWDAIESVRNVFERVISMGLKGKKLIPILKKYQEFEEKFGNGNNVRRLSDMMDEVNDAAAPSVRTC